ncbi:potassium:proton antiporter [Bacillus safensis]|uniref:potassium:proton antiporter n=1 Tax=Bacillus TaxID=1386 RepID=UPI001E523956|nr:MULTISPECIES: potassium:proton antiporter [Bacillus]MEC3738005.1 potassium:proton antiporter [Bacillus safensis]UDB51264.1 potassium:proton antiporter [Bacillus safensis]
MIRCSIIILVSFIVMFSPFSNVVFASQAEASTSMISPSIYDEEINAVKTPSFSKKHASSILLKDRLSMVDAKTFLPKPAPSAALSIDLCFLEMKCAIPVMYQSNYLY